MSIINFSNHIKVEKIANLKVSDLVQLAEQNQPRLFVVHDPVIKASAVVIPDLSLKVVRDLAMSRARRRWTERLEFALNLPFWVGHRWEARSFQTRNELIDLRVAVLDVPLWVTKTKFADTFHPVRLTHEQAFPLIEKLDAEHKEFRHCCVQ